MSTPLLSLYRRLQRWPAGNWLFSRAVCFKAPYFASIAPRITRLEHGRCEGTLADRRNVRNHIGTVHAIAMCNLAELTAGLMVDASLPADMRWIPKGMDVKYQAKALGTLKAVATPVLSIVSAADGYDLPVKVSVTDAAGTEVFHATIAMWVSPRPPRTG
ncbi:hotdog fold domain-containing protein [Stenotrophomonas geniculata]|uniref:hotdog fold domain-containing protein n=1 Tax=Stenotrophomonas geniculata TaxID=86188 RepID=UPI00234F4313|nr:hotdog fold domain-containing protein [Stenotrophomonas geniculata]MDC7802153.1 hotdog fold domain-containing protein [Stenotrophomonas geniculata]